MQAVILLVAIVILKRIVLLGRLLPLKLADKKGIRRLTSPKEAGPTGNRGEGEKTWKM